MTNKEQHIDYFELSLRYFSGEASEKDIQQLEAWVAEDMANLNQFREYKATWQLSGSANEHFDMQESWKKITQDIPDLAEESKILPLDLSHRRWPSIYRLAAAVVVFLTVGFFLYYILSATRTTELIATNQIEQNILDDGSEVTLNKHSRLSYSSKFNKKERRVKLIGAAWFDIERNESKPFFIETSEATIKVLGTSFYVNAKEEEPSFEVIVNSGLVRVSTTKNASIDLVAGEKGIYNKELAVLKKEINRDVNYLAWKTNTFVFDNTSLTEVVLAIEKTFDVKITIAKGYLNDCYLTATYIDYPLDEVLHLVSETLNLKVSRTGDEYVLDGEGCD